MLLLQSYAHMFKLVLTTGIYPDAVQAAKVIPVFNQ